MSGALKTFADLTALANPPALATHLHVPTPGDHYSPATGSAVMTIIHQMARFHQAAGSETQIIVSRGTRHDYTVGRCVEVAATVPTGGWRKAADLVCARMTLPRFFGEASYRPAAQAIPDNFRGVIFVHNNPAPLRMLRRLHPAATLCLWLHNEVFHTCPRAEVERTEAVVDRFICCSRYIADTIERRLQRPSHKVRVVHNGADVDVFEPGDAPRLAGSPVILFVGRVQPIKGPDLLIQAGLILAEAGHDFRLRIVGSAGFSATDPLSPYERHLRALAQPLGPKIEFVPFTDRHRIGGEFQGADIFCVPSNWDEPFGLTVAEGLAAGLPGVVARRGGIPEVGGDAVMYFDPPDTNALATQLAALLTDPALRRKMGAAARQRALSFSYAEQYRKLVQALPA